MSGLRIDFYSVIIFLGIVQGLFLSVLFLFKKDENRHFNTIMGIILFLFTVFNFDFFSAYTLLSLKYPHLIDISQPLGLAIGPILYLLYYFYANNKFSKKFFLHLSPFGIFLFNQLFYCLQSSDFKFNSFILSRNLNLPLRDVTVTFSSNPLGLRGFGGELIALSLCIYSVLMVKELFKILKKNNQQFWNITNDTIKWLRDFAFLTSILVIYVVFSQIFIRNPKTEYIIATYLTIVIYFISYQTIRNSFLIGVSFPKAKYQKSALNQQMKESIKNRILEHMENDKPYLHNLFSLKQLATNISISQNYVSQILNEVFHQTFFEFIASYRIKEAEKYLSDPQYPKKKIEEISFNVGYNSKAAFNKAFKKLTGKTPLQYKKNV